MRRRQGIAVAVTLLSLYSPSAGALAEIDTDGTNTRPPQIDANCATTGYVSGGQIFVAPIPVPDNSPTGVTTGPITLANQDYLIADVIVSIMMGHTWVGDVIAMVGYDRDSNGSIDVATRVICRPGFEGGCFSVGTSDGCEADLAGTFTFEDFAAGILPTFCAPNQVIGGGCFRPSGVGAGPLSSFEGLPGGGRWTLTVSDNRAGNVGEISGWSVHVLSGAPVAVASAPWSLVKVLFR